MDAVRLETAEAAWSPETGLIEPREGAAIAVSKDGAVVAIGAAADLTAAHPSLPVKKGRGILIPGLVNCHAHLELSALAGAVPGGDGLGGWVSRLVQRRSPWGLEQLEEGALEAARHMQSLGTVAVADVCTTLSTAPILREAGLYGVSLLEVVGADDDTAAQALADANRRLRTHPPTGDVDVRVIPHSAYGTAASAVVALKGKRGVRSIHVAEHHDEELWLLQGDGPFAPFLRSKGATPPGARPLSHLLDLGVVGPETLLVHVVLASRQELAEAAALGATVVLCPRSNLHIGGRLPDLRMIREAKIPWTLGTDSLASNPDFDLLAEVECLVEDFPEIPPEEILAAATVGGARALGLQVHPFVRVPRARLAFLGGGS